MKAVYFLLFTFIYTSIICQIESDSLKIEDNLIIFQKDYENDLLKVYLKSSGKFLVYNGFVELTIPPKSKNNNSLIMFNYSTKAGSGIKCRNKVLLKIIKNQIYEVLNYCEFYSYDFREFNLDKDSTDTATYFLEFKSELHLNNKQSNFICYEINDGKTIKIDTIALFYNNANKIYYTKKDQNSYYFELPFEKYFYSNHKKYYFDFENNKWNLD